MILLSDKLSFNFDISEVRECDIVFVSLDIETNIENESNLAPIEDCIKLILKYLEIRATLVILSQIPPGFCRKIQTNPGINIYYQVETLVFGNALERALYPERIIVGLADIPNQINL
jgi:UDPglucose 6-dehydrogenase